MSTAAYFLLGLTLAAMLDRAVTFAWRRATRPVPFIPKQSVAPFRTEADR